MYDNLIALRKSLGLDQKEFAESVGYKRTTYANYESGVRAPSSDFWIAVSKKYGVSIDYLMGVSDEPYPSKYDDFDEETKAAIKIISNLDDASKAKVLAILRMLPSEQKP